MLLAFVAGVAVGTIATRSLGNRYEYHTGQGGLIMWRCNKATGEVQMSGGGQPWQNIEPAKTSQKTMVFEETAKPDWAK